MSSNRRFYDDSLRLQEWDYSTPGFYFITILTKYRKELFGRIAHGSLIGNQYSVVLKQKLAELSLTNSHIGLDEFQIMPDHVHFIIEIKGVNWVGLLDKIHLQKIEKKKKDKYLIENLRFDDFMPADVDKKIDQNFLKSRRRMLIPKIVGKYKTITSKQINLLKNTQGEPVWTPGYFDQVIKTPDELERFREYIRANPTRFQKKPRSYKGAI